MDTPRNPSSPQREVGPALEAVNRFLRWLIPTVEKFPCTQKFLLGDRIQSAALDVLERPAVMGGKAGIRGLRVTVGMIIGQVGSGRTIDDLLADHPYLERQDILQALRYAAWRAEEREVVLTEG